MRRLLVSFALVVLASSCATTSSEYFDPAIQAGFSHRYHNDYLFATQTSQGLEVEVTARFDTGSLSDTLTTFVAVKNLTDSPIDVFPDSFIVTTATEKAFRPLNSTQLRQGARTAVAVATFLEAANKANAGAVDRAMGAANATEQFIQSSLFGRETVLPGQRVGGVLMFDVDRYFSPESSVQLVVVIGGQRIPFTLDIRRDWKNVDSPGAQTK